MIHLKKYILTLVALLAVTTQAWAEDTYKIVTTMTFNGWPPNTPIVKEAAASLPYTKKIIDWVETGENNANSIRNINVTGENIAKGTDTGWNTEITVNGAGTGNISFDLVSNSYSVTVTVTKNPTATPIPVAWDADTKTGTIASMPAGNVDVNVDYFPQAEFADGGAPAAITGVQASTDNPIVTPGTVKTIGTSSVKMGTVKYHASKTALTDADLLALGTDDWSSDVPKATNLSTGDAYVYYYIQGAEPASIADRSDANTCSDSDIKATNVVNVTLIAPPTYDVSLNKTGLATGEPDKWKAKSETVTTEVNLGEKDLEGVTKGETVTVTYTGSRKVIGVKAEKCVLLNISSPAFGHVIGIDGKNYAYDALPPAVTAVAMICHVDGEHGLALALADEGQMNWEDAMKNAAAHKPAFIGGTWKLPTMEEWDKMISAAGRPAYLRSAFSEVGGNDLLTKDYWSSTEDENNNLLAKSFNFLYSFGQSNDKTNGFYVRACLAF